MKQLFEIWPHSDHKRRAAESTIVRLQLEVNALSKQLAQLPDDAPEGDAMTREFHDLCTLLHEAEIRAHFAMKGMDLMTTNSVAIPTKYCGVNFRSRLEARYAAFFDIVGWIWEYEPLDLKGWIPDFRITISDHECCLLVEVKPYYCIDDFKDGPEYVLAQEGNRTSLPCDAVALFGANPSISRWMNSGSIPNLINDWLDIWKQAGNRVQWRRSEQPMMWAGDYQMPIGPCVLCHEDKDNWIHCTGCWTVICSNCHDDVCDDCWETADYVDVQRRRREHV